MAVTLTQAELSARSAWAIAPRKLPRLPAYWRSPPRQSHATLATPTRPRRKRLSMKRNPPCRTCSTSRTRAVGCLLQTLAAIRAPGRCFCPTGCTGAGSTGEAVAAAQEAMGTPGNQVVGVMVDSGYLVVTLADGSVTRQALPGMGGSEDRTARDAAAAAEATADGATTSAANAQAAANSASDAAAAAQGTADGAQTAAAAAQGAIAAHERAPHNTDGTARTAASAAQARADDAFALADEKVDPAGAASAARGSHS